MKQQILQWLALIGKAAGVVVGLGTIQGVPEKYGVVIFAVASILKDTTNRICDLLDDGELNNSVPPEVFGARQATQKPFSPAGPPLALLAMLIVALPLALNTGCKSPPEDVAFKTCASLEATVDAGMKAWVNYIVHVRDTDTAFYTSAQFAAQQDAVRKGYQTFRGLMNAAYEARARYAADQQAGLPAWQTAIDVASASAKDLIAVINLYLPEGQKI